MDTRWGIRITQSAFRIPITAACLVVLVLFFAEPARIEGTALFDGDVLEYVALVILGGVVAWLVVRFSRSMTVVFACAMIMAPLECPWNWVAIVGAAILLAGVIVDLKLRRNQVDIARQTKLEPNHGGPVAPLVCGGYRARASMLAALGVVMLTIIGVDGVSQNGYLDRWIWCAVLSVGLVAGAGAAILAYREYWVRASGDLPVRRLRFVVSSITGGRPDPGHQGRVDLCLLPEVGEKAPQSIAWVTSIRVLNAHELTETSDVVRPSLWRSVANRTRGYLGRLRGYPDMSFQAPTVIDPDRRLIRREMWPIVDGPVTVYGLVKIEAPLWVHTDNGVWCEVRLKPRANFWRHFNRGFGWHEAWDQEAEAGQQDSHRSTKARLPKWMDPIRRALRAVGGPLRRPLARVAPVMIPLLVAGSLALIRVVDAGVPGYVVAAVAAVCGLRYLILRLPPVRPNDTDFVVQSPFYLVRIPWDDISRAPQLEVLSDIFDDDDFDDDLDFEADETHTRFVGDCRHEANWSSAVQLRIRRHDGSLLTYWVGYLENLRAWDWEPRSRKLHHVSESERAEATPIETIHTIEYWFAAHYQVATADVLSRLSPREANNLLMTPDDVGTECVQRNWAAVAHLGSILCAVVVGFVVPIG